MKPVLGGKVVNSPFLLQGGTLAAQELPASRSPTGEIEGGAEARDRGHLSNVAEKQVRRASASQRTQSWAKQATADARERQGHYALSTCLLAN